MTQQAWLLLLCGGFVVLAWILVAAEAAYERLSRSRLADAAVGGSRTAARLLRMSQNPSRYVNVLLLANTLCTFAAMAALIAALLTWFPDRSGMSLIAATAGMTVVGYTVLGVSARTVGRQHPERVARATLGLVRLIGVLLHPVARLLILVGNAITPGRGFREGPFSSHAKLLEILNEAREAAVIEDQEQRMIHSVFGLGETSARQVMVPRTEMVFIERDKTLRQALSLCLRSGFSRIPVIGEDADDVVGLLFLKDLVRRIYEEREAESDLVETIMRAAVFVPDSKPADELLQHMQADRIHMAVVVDEFGGTAGAVTIEDILEEIVGEIDDEYDNGTAEIVMLGPGEYRLSARLSLERFRDLTGVAVDSDIDGVDTLGGLMSLRLGRVPIPGAQLVEQGWSLTAESAEGRRKRITTIHARRADTDDAQP